MQKAALTLDGWIMGVKVGVTGRLALCLQNAHDKTVLVRYAQ